MTTSAIIITLAAAISAGVPESERSSAEREPLDVLIEAGARLEGNELRLVGMAARSSPGLVVDLSMLSRLPSEIDVVVDSRALTDQDLALLRGARLKELVLYGRYGRGPTPIGTEPFPQHRRVEPSRRHRCRLGAFEAVCVD